MSKFVALNLLSFCLLQSCSNHEHIVAEGSRPLIVTEVQKCDSNFVYGSYKYIVSDAYSKFTLYSFSKYLVDDTICISKCQ